MSQTQTAIQKVTIGDRVIRSVFLWRRWQRLLFPSPLEVRFVQIMHGRALTVPFIKSRRTGFPLTLIWRGRLLRRELVQREVREGSRYIDYAVVTPYYKRGIELHGFSAHHDIVADQQRDEYLKARGWQLRYITAKQLREPSKVFVESLKFLKS